MPGIDISYLHGSMEAPVADAIKEAVRAYGTKHFSGLGLLEYGDFSFKFHEPHRFDELTDEIILRLGVRSLDGHYGIDGHAEALARLVAENIDDLVFGTIGVELRHDGQIGWGVSDLYGARPLVNINSNGG